MPLAEGSTYTEMLRVMESGPSGELEEVQRAESKGGGMATELELGPHHEVQEQGMRVRMEVGVGLSL